MRDLRVPIARQVLPAVTAAAGGAAPLAAAAAVPPPARRAAAASRPRRGGGRRGEAPAVQELHAWVIFPADGELHSWLQRKVEAASGRAWVGLRVRRARLLPLHIGAAWAHPINAVCRNAGLTTCMRALARLACPPTPRFKFELCMLCTPKSALVPGAPHFRPRA